jgi:hypothetical protein
VGLLLFIVQRNRQLASDVRPYGAFKSHPENLRFTVLRRFGSARLWLNNQQWTAHLQQIGSPGETFELKMQGVFVSFR